MVTAGRPLAIAALALAAWLLPAAEATAFPGPEGVREALGERGYPWYDESADKVVPVFSQPDWDSGWLKSLGDWIESIGKRIAGWFGFLRGWRLPGVDLQVGELIVYGLATLLLTVVLVLLLELLRRYRPIEGETARGVAVGRGEARRIEGLPLDESLDLSDPWAQAKRLRDRGDHAGAVIYLFAHQLITLARLGQLRLGPGRTGRQLVGSVPDAGLRRPVEPTLRLFETVYYGRKDPSPEAFDAVWRSAEDFERAASARLAEAGA